MKLADDRHPPRVDVLFTSLTCDHSGDEVVLVRILQVLLDCLRCPAGTLLSDQNVWDMVQIGYDIGRQARLSELLKRTAEHVLMQMILTLFSRFSQLQACEALALSIDGEVWRMKWKS